MKYQMECPDTSFSVEDLIDFRAHAQEISGHDSEMDVVEDVVESTKSS